MLSFRVGGIEDENLTFFPAMIIMYHIPKFLAVTIIWNRSWKPSALKGEPNSRFADKLFIQLLYPKHHPSYFKEPFWNCGNFFCGPLFHWVGDDLLLNFLDHVYRCKDHKYQPRAPNPPDPAWSQYVFHNKAAVVNSPSRMQSIQISQFSFYFHIS